MLYNIVRFIIKPFFFIFYGLRVEGIENLPKDTGYVLCANHLSALDPLILSCAIPEKINFMAKQELFRNKFISWLLKNLNAIPVKRGEADIKTIKASLKVLKNKQILGIFPEGTRNIKGEEKAEPGVSMLSIKSQVPVVPVAICGNYKLFRKTKVYIGKSIDLSEYYSMKLQNEQYRQISLQIMNIINNMVR